MNADFAAGTIVSNVARSYTIREDHRIIDRSTVHASRSLELDLADIVDEIPPVLDHQPTTSGARHIVFSSSIRAGDGELAHERPRFMADQGHRLPVFPSQYTLLCYAADTHDHFEVSDRVGLTRTFAVI